MVLHSCRLFCICGLDLILRNDYEGGGLFVASIKGFLHSFHGTISDYTKPFRRFIYIFYVRYLSLSKRWRDKINVSILVV